MSDTKTEWRALEREAGWEVWAVDKATGIRTCIAGYALDKPTAHRIAAVNELEASLKHIVKEWDGEPEDMHDARMALAKARGDEPPEAWTKARGET